MGRAARERSPEEEKGVVYIRTLFGEVSRDSFPALSLAQMIDDDDRCESVSIQIPPGLHIISPVGGDIYPDRWGHGVFGRVRMWRGGLRCGLSVSAPFVWRCLTSRTITPFPHPPHRTGRADCPHPALGQDACLRTREVSCGPPAHRTGPCYHGVQRPGELQTTASVAPWASIRSPDRNPSSLFASACGAFRSCRTLQEFPRVTPISRASPLSAPVLNGGPFPPPALPGFLGNAGLSATPARPL